MKQSEKDYLQRDIWTNIDMLEILHLPKASVVQSSDCGVLLRHDNLLLLSADPGKSAEFLPMLTRGLDHTQDQIVVLHNDELKKTLETDFAFQTVTECRHAIYCSNKPIIYSLPPNAEIRKLDARYVDFVHTHYHMVDDIEYIKERIEADMFGVFVDGEIAGFVGTHEERPMGMLEILPEYRRMGLGYLLEAHLINYLLASGRVPFCQVAVYNEASLRLQQKLGLTLSETIIYWLAQNRTN